MNNVLRFNGPHDGGSNANFYRIPHCVVLKRKRFCNRRRSQDKNGVERASNVNSRVLIEDNNNGKANYSSVMFEANTTTLSGTSRLD